MPRTARPKRVQTADGFAARGHNARRAGSEYQEPDGSWRATYHDDDGTTRRCPGLHQVRPSSAGRPRSPSSASAAPARTGHRPDHRGGASRMVARQRGGAQSATDPFDRYRFPADRISEGLSDVCRRRADGRGLTARHGKPSSSIACPRDCSRHPPGVVAQGRRHAAALGLIARSPLDRVPHPKLVRQPRVALTSRQARHLLAASSNRWYAAWSPCCSSRAGECPRRSVWRGSAESRAREMNGEGEELGHWPTPWTRDLT